MENAAAGSTDAAAFVPDSAAAAAAAEYATHTSPMATLTAAAALVGPDPASLNTPAANLTAALPAAGVSSAATVNTPAATPPPAATAGGPDAASHNTPAANPVAASPAAGVSPAAAVKTPTVTPPPAAAGPPTPLEQRQWQRLAQRSIRLAVTAFKDAETRVLEATTQGTGLATQLTNSMLSERYLPSLELPDVLKGIDGLQRAAIQKLKRQQRQLLQQLEEQLLVITDAVQDMEAAVADISSNLQPSSSWQHSLAIFHTLALPESRDLLLQISSMYNLEVASKQGLLESYRQFVAGSSKSRDTNSSLESSNLGVDELRKVLTVAVTTWMVRPYVDLEACQQLLQVLTDEMVGF